MAKVSKNPGTYLHPCPAIMASCGPLSRPNIITLAWVGTVCSDPPMISVAIRPSRFSYGLIKESGQFAINLPTAQLAHVTDYCGNTTGRTEDKFASMGLTALPGKVVQTAIICECPVNIECQVMQILALGSHDLFLGKVVAVHVDEEIQDAQGDIDLSKANPLVYGSRQYWSIGQMLGTHGYSVKR